MQNQNLDLGEKLSVHLAPLSWLWLLLLCLAPVLLVTIVSAGYAVNSLTPASTDGKAHPSGSVAGSFACLAGSGLLLALVGGVVVSDFRKWSATRTAKLVIYERGFMYESEGRQDSGYWDDIKHIDLRLVEVKGKHSAPRKVSVIRSIVKSDGTVVSLAETLNLRKVTELIKRQARRPI